jgi:hypothetical protein
LSNADETFQALKKNWGVASSKGAKVLALTLLESNVRSAYLERDRDGLNQKILSHKAPNLSVKSLTAWLQLPRSIQWLILLKLLV